MKPFSICLLSVSLTLQASLLQILAPRSGNPRLHPTSPPTHCAPLPSPPPPPPLAGAQRAPRRPLVRRRPARARVGGGGGRRAVGGHPGRAGAPSPGGSNSNPLAHLCYAFAMPLLCLCYAFAVPLLCLCYAFAMPLLCLCYAFAMPLLCRGCAAALRLRCRLLTARVRASPLSAQTSLTASDEHSVRRVRIEQARPRLTSPDLA